MVKPIALSIPSPVHRAFRVFSFCLASQAKGPAVSEISGIQDALTLANRICLQFFRLYGNYSDCGDCTLPVGFLIPAPADRITRA
jgi:hypothetical protein